MIYGLLQGNDLIIYRILILQGFFKQQQSLIFNDIRGVFGLFFLVHSFMLTRMTFYPH